MPHRVYRLRKARRPSGPASRKPLIARARLEAPVAKIEVRWPWRTVMNCLKVYGPPLIQDGNFHTKRPTLHCDPVADMLTRRVSQMVTGDQSPEQENSIQNCPPESSNAPSKPSFPTVWCQGRGRGGGSASAAVPGRRCENMAGCGLRSALVPSRWRSDKSASRKCWSGPSGKLVIEFSFSGP
jgi:hypothetical protein